MSNKIVMLPCHSVWIPSVLNDPTTFQYGFERSEWELVSFQIEGYDHLAFIEQILKCLILVDKTTSVFLSGGYTKKNTPDISESKSYYVLLEKYYQALSNESELAKLEQNISDTKNKSLINTFKKFKTKQKSDIIIENIFCEEYALDSFENLYYSLAYYKFVNENVSLQDLKSVTIVGFEFKEARFSDLHWKYIGCLNQLKNCELLFDSNNPNTLDEETNKAYIENVFKSEKKFGYDLFVEDPFGRMKRLKTKKQDRNIKNLIATESAPFKKYLIKFDDKISTEELLLNIQNSALYF